FITPNAGTAALCSYRQWSLRNAISRAWKVSRKAGAIQFKTQVTLTQIKQRGPYRLRGRANAERLAAAIELLKDLGHIVKDGGHYNFKESILTEEEPRTKNGEFITISALPLYRDQEYLLEDRVSGRLRSGRYYIKNLK
ncbi:hypothetical protein ACNFIA_29980, partial [Pseudomonas sp. NY15437]|uniref:hypothetical protein n=1 Tax=Pseudomonas sp. NY15437 TaxID=3400360 RepID=UPI003A836BDB